MEILLRAEPGAEPVKLNIEEGCTLEEIAQRHERDAGYNVYAARVDNRVVSLRTRLTKPCEVVLLDLRDPSGKQCYQNSVLALYLSAVKQLFPGEKVVISNSLNKGIFTFIGTGRRLSVRQVAAVEALMIDMCNEAVPLSELDPDLSLVVPSADYIRYFRLVKCRGGIVVCIPQETAPDIITPYHDDLKLYEAFSLERHWDRMLGIRYMADLNRSIEKGEINDIIRICEALHEKKIAQIADRIVRRKKRVVLIAGPSSSGKTSFAKRLCTQLWVNGEKPIYLCTDDYFRPRREIPFGPDGKQDFESLSAVDVELFNKQLNQLLAGEETDLPRFDFPLGELVFGERITKAYPGQPIVIEGIHGLNDALTPQIPASEKFRIYISPLSMLSVDDHHRIPLTDIRKLRRIVRDANKRGWTATHTIDNWYSVRMGEAKNIFPYANEADVFFNSSFVYELAVLKKNARPMLEVIPEDDECFTEAQRLLNLLSYVDELDDDSFIPNNSLIREFIGGSVLA